VSYGDDDSLALPRCSSLALAAQEGASPDPINLFSSTFQVNAYRAERAYRKHLREARSAESESGLHMWKMDNCDRIYYRLKLKLHLIKLGFLEDFLGG